MPELIDYIVLDVDGGFLLERCVDSIRRQSLPPSKIIILDNGSRAPVRDRIPASSDLNMIRSETNLGFAGGVNLAMRSSNAPLVAWINNDCVLDPEWSARLGAAVQGGVAAAQSIIVAPGGTIDGAGIEISSGTFIQTARGLAADAEFRDPWGVSGTAALYRRAALDAVATPTGPLDERFFAYYEDVELSARLRAGGWQLVTVRAPLAVHEGSRSASLLGRRGDQLRIRNRYFVRRLHRGVGRYRSLLAEDLRRLLRDVVSRRPLAVLGTLTAVWSGLLYPLRDSRVGSRRQF